MLLPYDLIHTTLFKVMRQYDFDEEGAALNAQIFTDSTQDGYHSHGVNRFGQFIKNVQKGIVKPRLRPLLSESLGVLERYDGQQGPGPSNAHLCMERAIQIAKENTMGCVALRNSNHWMRGGAYGWQAAASDCIAICFTNTMPNMPPWGGTTNTTGNNPLIIAVPRLEGHVVLDMSLSQFSYGKIYESHLHGKSLPFAGGYNKEGKLTDIPGEIMESRRILQTGYWKGSGLSIMLDLLSTLMSNGLSTSAIGKLEGETSLSQVFLCINAQALGDAQQRESVGMEIINHFKGSEAQQESQPVRYPGESTLARRLKQRKEGIDVDDSIWNGILALLS
ncbi:UNVERIFIED_CONTAM: hypothetical protein GTU68_062337 [Idotea baltica]|nr:hypothetical protein [Idotea baltica]